MRSRIYVTAESPSVCPSGLLLIERRAVRRYQSTAAGAQQQWRRSTGLQHDDQ